MLACEPTYVCTYVHTKLTYELLNFGRQIGIHDSAVRKLVEADTRFRIRWMSEGGRLYSLGFM